MVLVNEYSVAKNGMHVQSDVDLSIGLVGVEECPFRVIVRVESCRMFTAHYPTEAEAKEVREQMHASYLEAQGGRADD